MNEINFTNREISRQKSHFTLYNYGKVFDNNDIDISTTIVFSLNFFSCKYAFMFIHVSDFSVIQNQKMSMLSDF